MTPPPTMTPERREELREEMTAKPPIDMGYSSIENDEVLELLAAADRVDTPETAMRSAVQALTVPSAEYVPAMPEAWGILLDALGESEEVSVLVSEPPPLVLPSNNDQPWPTRDAIDRICEFTEDRLGSGSYDGEGHEGLKQAAQVVRAALEGKQCPIR